MHRELFRTGGLFGAALLALSACSSDETAVPVTEEGAARIVAGIKEEMDVYFADTPELDFQWAGEVTAVPAKDHYDVTIPALRLVADDGRFDVGAVQMVVIADADGTYRFDVKVPPVMTVSDGSGMEVARLSIGGQSYTGRWVPAWATALDYEFAYEKVAVDIQPPSGKQVRIDIGRLSGVSSATPARDDLLDLKSSFEAADFSVAGPDVAIAVKSNRFESSMNAVDVGRLMESMKELQQIEATQAAVDFSDADVSAAEKRIVTVVGELLTSYGERMDVGWTAKGIAVDGGGKHMTLDGVTFGMDTANESLSSVGIRLGLEGVALNPAPLPAELLPTRFAVDLQAGKLPVKELWGNFLRLMEMREASGTVDPEMEALVGQDVLAALSAAASELRLQDLSVSSATSALDGSGGMTVSGEAAMGMTADYTLVVRDIGSVVKALSPGAGQQPNQEMMGALMLLGMLQGMGQAGTAEDGVQTLTYAIKIAPDGRVLLNGNDLSALMGAMGAVR